MLKGMVLVQKMTARTDRFDHIQGQRVCVHLIGFFDAFDHPANFIIDDEFFIGHAAVRFQDTGAVQHEINPADLGHQQTHHRFIGRLSIRHLGITDSAAASDGQIVKTRHLRCCRRIDRHLR